MKLNKALLIAVIVGLLGLSTCFSAVFAAQTLQPLCYDTGRLVMNRYGSDTGYVYAKRPDSEDWFNVPGTWAKNGRMMKFTSDDMVLPDRIQYDIEVHNEKTKLGTTDVLCPGFRLSCKNIMLEPKECRLKGDEYYVEFTAENIDAVDELSYYFKAESGKIHPKTQVMASKELIDFFVSEIEQDRYVIGFKTNEFIESFSVTHPYCDERDEPYHTYETIPCNIEKCSSDSDCKSTQYCDSNKGICKDLVCDYCTYEHACLDKGYVMPIGGISYFCNDNGMWQSQKNDSKSCLESYECLGNCDNGLCLTPVDEPEPEPLMEKNETNTAAVVFEEPAPFSSLLYTLQIVSIIIICVGIIIFTLRYPLPAIGRYALDLERTRKDTIFRRINNFLDQKILEEKARLRSRQAS